MEQWSNGVLELLDYYASAELRWSRFSFCPFDPAALINNQFDNSRKLW
jgi:hypothetical protein